MKALSIRQPWAWAILHGAKRVENRTWRTNYRGQILIHAGAKRCAAGLVLPDGTPVPDPLDYGALLGVATIVDCVPLAEAPAGPFTEGPFCWLLDDVKPFAQPIPFSGQLQLFEVPDEVVSGSLPAS